MRLRYMLKQPVLEWLRVHLQVIFSKQVMINQLLDLSKLEAGRMHLHVRLHNLNRFLGYLISSFSSLADRKHIALSYGPEEYVKVSSMFTNGALQFRNNLDKVMALEERSLKTVAPVEILAARIDMTLNHDRLSEIASIDRPSLVIGTRDDATVPFYFAEDLAGAITDARLHIMEEGGHYSYRRHPDEWNALVGGFIEAVEAGE